jgi:CubicO group peptidase (beta-lactamase class C family)
MRRVTAFATLALVTPFALVAPSRCFAAAPAAATAPEAAPAAAASAGAIAAIDRIASAEIDQKKVASYAVAVVKDGRIVLARGYGFADLENEVPATAETVYRLGSITKQFTAMAIMLLVEDGKLSVDDELTKFLPDYPIGERKITIRHLLNHTAGLKDYTRTRDFDKFARLDHSHDEMRALFQNEPPDFAPGTRWGYSNANYYLLGLIIEQASGQKYEDFLEQRIFQPLHMSATRYGHPQQLIPRRANGYKYFFGQLTNDDGISMDPPFAAGALVSNIIDMIKWHQALEAGALVSSKSYEEMARPTTLANGTSRPYGYGWRLGRLSGHNTIGHGGGINGFSTMISRYPDDRLAVVVLSNTSGADPGAVSDRIAKVMLGIEEEAERRENKPDAERPDPDKSNAETPIADSPIDAALLEQLTGKYRFMDEEIEIISQDGQLLARLKGRTPDRLQHQGERKFVHAGDSELRITFTPHEGQATEFEVQGPRYKFGGKRVE